MLLIVTLIKLSLLLGFWFQAVEPKLPVGTTRWSSWRKYLYFAS